jgi:hypothetical protein
LNLLNDPIYSEQVELKTRWGDISTFDLVSSNDSMAIFIDVVNRESNKTILSFALIPWQEMSSKRKSGDQLQMISMPDYQLHTVTPFAVIYRIDPHTRSGSDNQLADKACVSLDYFFDYEGCQTIISARDAYTAVNGAQVMELNEYPWYADLQIAIPGTNTGEMESLAEDFGCRMIRLNMIPESGIAHTRWLVSQENPLGNEAEIVENTLLPIFQEAVESCIRDDSQEKRRHAYEKAHGAMAEILDRPEIHCEGMGDFYTGLLERLLFYRPAVDIAFDTNDPFPDYVPKMTPDEMLDFMPELGDEFAHLPPAEAEHIAELVQQYKTYRKAVRRNPGKWIEGNPVLGGKLKEYQPSREELILSEIGERIRHIAEEEGSNGIKAIMKAQDAKKKKIKYKKFTFIHMDVMGSGRYYYVEEIEKVNLKLY